MVTVIVPVYNVENFLPECIESILTQDYKDLEIFLVDDGSTDKSGNICDSYAKKDSRIIVIHQENQGISAARNAALDAERKGEYIVFIDSDDYVAPNYVSCLLDAMNIHEGADVVLCRFYNNFLQEDGNYLPTPCISYADKECLTSKEVLIRRFIEPSVYYILAWNKLYKRNLFETMRFPVGHTCEDRWISLELFLNCKKIVCINEALYYYRSRKHSIIHDTSINWIIAQLDYYKHEIEYYQENDLDNLKYPAKPFVSLIYKNRKRIPQERKLYYQSTWKLAIKTLLVHGNLKDCIKYMFSVLTYR